MILGIDQSLNKLAAIIYDLKNNLIYDFLVIGNLKKYSNLNKYNLLIDNKQFETKQDYKIYRLEYITSVLFNFINVNKEILDLICMEGYSYHSVSRSTYEIGELGGVIKYLMLQNNLLNKFKVIEPTVIKKTITGKGNAKKELVYNCLKNRIDIKKFDVFKDYIYDLSDATALALTVSSLCNTSL